MKIEECRIRQKVRANSGRTGEIVKLDIGGACIRQDDGREFDANINCIEPVSDPCEGCQKLAESYREGRKDEWRDNRQRIAELRQIRDEWEVAAQQHYRNATYWREELEKLQKEALAECKPLGEAAKIYATIRLDASQLLAGIREVQGKLLSDDAKIVCELLDGSGPMTSSQIADRLHLLERCILESIAEARDAGKIRLVNGKYEIARD